MSKASHDAPCSPKNVFVNVTDQKKDLKSPLMISREEGSASYENMTCAGRDKRRIVWKFRVCVLAEQKGLACY
jgi:hypothetical protein